MASVFISYARENEKQALRLYSDLRRAGVDVWLDREALLPGQQWKTTIENAIRNSRYFLALLSSESVNRRGYVQKELMIALDVLDEFPSADIFLIPARLDACAPGHPRLKDLHWVDLFPDWDSGVAKILRTIGNNSEPTSLGPTSDTTTGAEAQRRPLSSPQHEPTPEFGVSDPARPPTSGTLSAGVRPVWDRLWMIVRAAWAAPLTRRLPPRFGRVMLLCLGHGIALLCEDAYTSHQPSRLLLGELARELDAVPVVSPRLSISPAHRACLRRADCPTRPAAKLRERRLADIALRAAEDISKRPDPNAMHAAALFELINAPDTELLFQRSILLLQRAARLADHPGAVLSDLAAAYLIRAERAHTPRDLVAAIEVAEEALEREPQNQAAKFNRALALQRLGLVDEAAEDWREYLQIDSVSAWADEARNGLKQIAAVDAPPPPPWPDAPLPSYTAYATADPQRGRELGWCRVLGAWAAATLEGHGGRAEAHLQRASTLASALQQRPGGDATLADAVATIRRSAVGGGLWRLASAHREFAAGCTLEDRLELRAAAPRFAAAEATADGSPTLRAWARLSYGNMVFQNGDAPTGEAIFREIAADADSIRYPSLAGAARQLISAVLLRGNRYVGVLEEARNGAGLFARAGERENEGAMLDALSVAQFSVGDMDEGYVLAHRALQQLRPYRTSHRLHNLLTSTALMVSGDGFRRSAVRLLGEGVRVAERTGNPVYVAEARLSRARLLVSLGEVDRAGEDMAISQRTVQKLGDSKVWEWMIAQRQLAEAASLAANPARAAAALDSAAAFFLEMHAPQLALPAMVNGAQAHLAIGDLPRGIERLETALAILEARRASIRMETRRAAVFDEAQGVVNRVTMLKLASGKVSEALSYWDLGRALLAPVGPTSTAIDSVVTGPHGEVVLEYAQIADTLLIWTVAGEQVEIFRTVIDTIQLARVVERLNRGVEVGFSEALLLPDLTQLYDWLIRPVEGRLGSARIHLVVVAHGSISSIPFAALYDQRRGRYFIEDHPIRFAASLRMARSKPTRSATNPPVFVADPALDPSMYPFLDRLPGAMKEVRDIAALYPRVNVLSGGQANEDALRAAFGRASMIHYAGHAVLDDERPERSYLLLAQTRMDTGSERLTAREIAQLDLRHLSLVVLSACHTMRTGAGRADGFSALAGAFLAAGAGGAVGSLWAIDDRRTQALMLEFHRAHRRSRNGASALRSAQLYLLRSRDESLRSPAAWAGFQYTGA